MVVVVTKTITASSNMQKHLLFSECWQHEKAFKTVLFDPDQRLVF